MENDKSAEIRKKFSVEYMKEEIVKKMFGCSISRN